MKRYTFDHGDRNQAFGYEPASMQEAIDGEYILHSDHEAALKAAVAAEREKSAEMLTQFSATIRHQCRGRIGDLVANMALDHAAAIRSAAHD